MTLTSDDDELDVNYRPDTYFRPHKLEQYLLSKVKGAVVREKLQALFDEGRHAEVGELLSSAGLSAPEHKLLESIHPMFMGGNYLPDTEAGEVEIARISIQSTTFDVTCVYARKENGVIHFRVVDEYDGDTLQGQSEAQSTLPMTLGEFTDYFLQVWPLMDVLESNFEDDLESALGFFSAQSDFYPDLDTLCRGKVVEHFPEQEQDAGDQCPICQHLNSPTAYNICEHISAFVWDGQVEALHKTKSLNDALEELLELVESAKDDEVEKLILEEEARRHPTRAALIESVSGDFDLVETLQSLAQARVGEGWSTGGMIGGFGYNVYVPSQQKVEALTAECRAVIQACSMKINTSISEADSLENRRPINPVEWQLVTSGFWAEDVYHRGHIAYYLARTGQREWIMEGVERNVELDGLTEEDIEEGRVNDDQLQAMWGMTLEEAQNVEYRKIVAVCSAATPDVDAEYIAAVLYRAVCAAGGKVITEPDECRHSLLSGLQRD